MIVTLTLNPSLDRAIEVDALEPGAVIRAASVAARRSLMRGMTSLLVVTGDAAWSSLSRSSGSTSPDHPELAAGVRLLAGEARARHVHAVDGAAVDLLVAWRGILGDAMWVVSREEAIAGGWFGPHVSDRVRARIGDVVAAARDAIGVFDRRTRPGEAGMLGHHGSMTPGRTARAAAAPMPVSLSEGGEPVCTAKDLRCDCGDRSQRLGGRRLWAAPPRATIMPSRSPTARLARRLAQWRNRSPARSATAFGVMVRSRAASQWSRSR